MTPLATGDLKLLKKLCPNGIAPRSNVARVGIRQSGRVAVVNVDSILDREAWRRLERAIETASRRPGVEVLLLKISCPAAAWFGSDVESALAEARKRGVLTVAYIETAFGLALDLALRCQVVFANPTAMIGELRCGYPWGTSGNWPTVESFDECLAAPFLDGSLEGRRLSKVAVFRLQAGTMNGEQAEAHGVVDFLARSARAVVRKLNRIGAKTR
jgi:enoyl-CoA hydratase/carnithine racemase